MNERIAGLYKQDEQIAAERDAIKKQCYRALNTADGRAMMDELRASWFEHNPLDANPQMTGFNVGLSEAFKQLERWQKGEGLDTTGELPDG